MLYDPTTSKLSFIDFAEADYHFIYHDIFAPVQLKLGVHENVYQTYTSFHNHALYPMPDLSDPALRQIMMNRAIGVYLKRFIKASDDLRKNPRDAKSQLNNIEKIAYMRQQIQHIHTLQSQMTL